MRYGAAHVRGLYNVPNDGQQFKNGCDAIWNLGLRTLKVYCTGAYVADYPLQTSWSSTPTNLTQLAQTTQFTEQLNKAWDTVVFTAFTFANNPGAVTNWWRVEPTRVKLQAEYDELYAFAVHLLSTYNDSGKRFVVQNWEGDWAFQDSFVADSFTARRYVDYYAAFAATRQRAVSDARMATAHRNVTILNAWECNRVLDAKDTPHRRRILTDIAKRFRPDMVSYSAYDSTIDFPGTWQPSHAQWVTVCTEKFNRALRLLQKAFPGVPIQIGEFGYPENEATNDVPTADVGEMVEVVRDIAQARGVDTLLYWEVFDNEAHGSYQYRGYWLRKPDGALSIAGGKFQTYAAGG